MRRAYLWPLLLVAGLMALALVACESLTPTEDPLDSWRITCEELHDDIITMSKSSGLEILKFVGDAGLRTNRTSERLDCFSEVRTARGKFYIDYYLGRDPDGEQFIGYELNPSPR